MWWCSYWLVHRIYVKINKNELAGIDDMNPGPKGILLEGKIPVYKGVRERKVGWGQ